MASITNTFDKEELEAWLNRQPKEVSVVIAARCALRVLPLLRGTVSVKSLSTALVLPVYRTVSSSLSYVSGSDNATERLAAAKAAIDASATAIDSVDVVLDTAAAAINSADVNTYVKAVKVAHAAVNAGNAAAHAAHAAVAAAVARAAGEDATDAVAPTATDTAASAIKAAASAIDVLATVAVALSSDRHQIDNGRQVSQLTWAPLWPDRLMPDDVARDWKALKASISRRKENWNVWIDWYEDRLNGAPLEPAVLATARCTLPEPMWKEGAEIVNTAIRELIDLYGKGGTKAVEARMAAYRQQYPDIEGSSSAQSSIDARSTSAIRGRNREESAERATGDPEQSEDLVGAPSDFSETEPPRAWILQYAANDRVARWTRGATPGSTLHWKSGRALPKAMQAGDPVVYWRTIDSINREDRGGLVGVGRVLSTETQDDDGTRRFPTQVIVFNDTPLPRDEVTREAGITRSNWQGAVLRLRPEETERLDVYLRAKGMPGLIERVSPPLFVETHDTDYVSDRPETDKDLLNRASLAFTLAYNINKIWTVQTTSREMKGRCRRTLDWLHFERLNRQTREPDEAAFILHLDAPWGGGKTTFANFVARILNPAAHGYDMSDRKKLEGTLLGGLPLDDPRYWNPEFASRRWFVVDFNAWQNEHVSPPWWNFYEAIRGQCLRAVLFEPGRFGSLWKRGILPRMPSWCRFHTEVICGFARRVFSWCRFQMTELIWRVWTPEVRNTLLLLSAVGALLYWVVYSHWLNALVNNLSPTLKDMFNLAGIAVTAGGAGLVLVNAFRSGLKTIIESAGKSANAPSLGEADPIQKFRRHFSWFVSQLNEPILVIVDDLDRCSPKYVVELVRGLLTIFQSPRVVFVLLGDKDWIETAFANIHKEMADVHTDAQITFGGRFAEKVIQLSFLLPEFDHDAREAYLTAVLATGQEVVPEDLKDTVDALQRVEAQARANLADTDRAEDQEAAAQRTESLIRETSAQTTTEHREAFEKAAMSILNRERMLRAATARSTETVVRQHGLKPLMDFLPANPRRIKRIINMVSAYQASAQSTQGVAQGSDKWKQLVIWVVIMSEYPQVWKTLVTNSDLSTQLLDLIQTSKRGETVVTSELPKDASDADKVRYSALAALLATPGLIPLLRGDPFIGDEDIRSPARIDADAREWLRRLTPID